MTGDERELAQHYRFALTYLRTNDLAVSYCDSRSIPYDVARRGEYAMAGRHLLETDAVLLQITEANVVSRQQFNLTHETTIAMALESFQAARGVNNPQGMIAAVGLIARLNGLELQIEAENVERLGLRIKEVLATYVGGDVRGILEQAAPQAAALLAEVATGGIPASTAERVAAAKNIIDRVKGTPIGMDVLEAKSTADQMLERIKKIETGRAVLTPVGD